MTAFLKASLALGFAASLMMATASSSEAQSARVRTVAGSPYSSYSPYSPYMTNDVVVGVPTARTGRVYYGPGYYRTNAANAAYGAYAYSPRGSEVYWRMQMPLDGASGCASDGNYNQIDYFAC